MSKLTEEYDISEKEVRDLKDNIEHTMRRMFNQRDIDIRDESIVLVQQRMIDDCYMVLNDLPWDSDTSSVIETNTPEGHFRELSQEMAEDGSAAEMNISFILGTLLKEVEYDSPIYQYIGGVMKDKYER